VNQTYNTGDSFFKIVVTYALLGAINHRYTTIDDYEAAQQLTMHNNTQTVINDNDTNTNNDNTQADLLNTATTTNADTYGDEYTQDIGNVEYNICNMYAISRPLCAMTVVQEQGVDMT